MTAGIVNPAQCCCDIPPPEPDCNCGLQVSPTRCTVSWQCTKEPHAVIVARINPETDEILEIMSTAKSGYFNPPIGSTNTYVLLVCCAEPNPADTDDSLGGDEGGGPVEEP
jgi:hypothetical protein